MILYYIALIISLKQYPIAHELTVAVAHIFVIDLMGIKPALSIFATTASRCSTT